MLVTPIFSPRASCVSPVSYTHLDVYKRQSLRYSITSDTGQSKIKHRVSSVFSVMVSPCFMRCKMCIRDRYQPLLLNEYIGNGQPWDLDRLYGGVHVLPPYQTATGSDWYKGTANAIYQNINFIERYDPEYVLILSGDHIYKMDYGKRCV